MRSSYSKLYIHYVWSTWKRIEFIDSDLEPILKRLIRDKISENKCHLLAFGCTTDHIHLLVKLHPTTSVSRLAKEIKGYTSFTIANKIYPSIGFRWQGGYGAMTVSESNLPQLKKYIRNQKEHHQ